jgi:chemotaxis methyl-accepting protein methylase
MRGGVRRMTFRRRTAERVKIYATDIDEDALAVARQAVYSAKAVESVPHEWRERYFEPADRRFSPPRRST